MPEFEFGFICSPHCYVVTASFSLLRCSRFLRVLLALTQLFPFKCSIRYTEKLFFLLLPYFRLVSASTSARQPPHICCAAILFVGSNSAWASTPLSFGPKFAQMPIPLAIATADYPSKFRKKVILKDKLLFHLHPPTHLGQASEQEILQILHKPNCKKSGFFVLLSMVVIKKLSKRHHWPISCQLQCPTTLFFRRGP